MLSLDSQSELPYGEGEGLSTKFSVLSLYETSHKLYHFSKVKMKVKLLNFQPRLALRAHYVKFGLEGPPGGLAQEV